LGDYKGQLCINRQRESRLLEGWRETTPWRNFIEGL